MKQWQIGKRAVLEFLAGDCLIGFYVFDRGIWLHIPMVRLCLYWGKGSMWGDEELYYEWLNLKDDQNKPDNEIIQYIANVYDVNYDYVVQALTRLAKLRGKDG